MSHHKTIYCNVHRQHMEWSPTLQRIIDTPEFQRLRHIKQLGTCHYVFPGATHTRFAHSLGTGYLAERFVMTLLRNQPGCMLRPQSSDTDQSVCHIFKLAGLCHDLGHGPMSHGFDAFLARHSNRASFRVSAIHEERSVAILQHIIKAYKIPIEASEVAAACELILPPAEATQRTLPPCWYDIISNVFDVDKLDYLQRDSMMLGIPSCGVAVQRFFDYARVRNGHVCFSYKLRWDVHQLFMARHRLHAQVYQHPVVRALEHMHLDFMEVLSEGLLSYLTSLSTFCELTDDIFTSQFVELLYLRGYLSTSQKQDALALLRRISTRQLYTLLQDGKGHVRLSATVSRSPPEWLLLDCISIGYQTNPIFNVRFYATDSTEWKYLSPDMVSVTFPLHAMDIRTRVYSKRNEDTPAMASQLLTSILETSPEKHH
jgi:HD superfamily phosphohydrolase